MIRLIETFKEFIDTASISQGSRAWTIYGANPESGKLGLTWKKWSNLGYDSTPGHRSPEDTTILYDSEKVASGTIKSAILLQLQTILRTAGIYVIDLKLGLIVWKNLDNGQTEARWLTYIG